MTSSPPSIDMAFRYSLFLLLLTGCLSSDTTFLVSSFPAPTRPKHRDSVAGWYPAVHTSGFALMLPCPSSIPHAHCVPSTEIQSMAGRLQSMISFSPVRVLPLLEPLPFFVICVASHRYCLPIDSVTVDSQFTPTRIY